MAEPLYRRIMADIRARIASGEWGPAAPLPSTRELTAFYAAHLSVPDLAPGTVRVAISLLIELDELRGQQGKGVYVAGEPGGSSEA